METKEEADTMDLSIPVEEAIKNLYGRKESPKLK